MEGKNKTTRQNMLRAMRVLRRFNGMNIKALCVIVTRREARVMVGAEGTQLVGGQKLTAGMHVAKIDDVLVEIIIPQPGEMRRLLHYGNTLH